MNDVAYNGLFVSSILFNVPACPASEWQIKWRLAPKKGGGKVAYITLGHDLKIERMPIEFVQRLHDVLTEVLKESQPQ